MDTPIRKRHAFRPLTALALGLGVLAGCTNPETPVDVFDPFEEQNRQAHAFNRSFDQAVLRPASQFYGEALPPLIRNLLDNVADNISLSGDVVNDILQAEADDATHNAFRFAINTTLGIGGLFDPATSFGLDRRRTGFGETLETWGVPEGAYLEVPFVGPSTEREAVGVVADFFTNAFSYALDGPSALAAAGVAGVDVVNNRFEFSTQIDEVLYRSEDSYISARTLYLQNLRFGRGGAQADEQAVDIFDEIYGQ